MLSFLNEILTHLCFADTIYVEKSGFMQEVAGFLYCDTKNRFFFRLIYDGWRRCHIWKRLN